MRGYWTRSMVVVAVLLVSSLWAGAANAQQRGRGQLGLGLILGSPTGLSLEYNLGSSSAIHAALGVEGVNNRGRDDDFYIHVVWKLYLAELANTGSFSVPIYVGIGGFLADIGNDRDNDNIDLGVRAPFGIALAFNRAPLDIFLELPLLLQVVDDVDLGIGAALGFHYFF